MILRLLIAGAVMAFALFPRTAEAQSSAGSQSFGSPYFSAASTNCTNVKPSPGRLYTVTISQSTTTAMELKLYNLAAAPASAANSVGLVDIIPILSTATANTQPIPIAYGPFGRYFNAGISFCIVAFGAPATAADSSNAATGVVVSFTGE